MRVSTWETGLAGQSRNLFHSGCEPLPHVAACVHPPQGIERRCFMHRWSSTAVSKANAAADAARRAACS